MINLFASPIYLQEDIEALAEHTDNLRVKIALADVVSDLQEIHKLTKVIDKWSSGLSSDNDLLSSYNIYRSNRAKISLGF
jgi:hypothetical protein